MTQLSNIPMQPNPNAVDRPLTLIEKLEQEVIEHNAEFNKFIGEATDHQKVAHTAVLAGLLSAISEYPTLYSVGLFRQYASGHVWLSLVEAETYIDESKILAWQPMNEPSNDFFESLEQPPSEVQDD